MLTQTKRSIACMCARRRLEAAGVPHGDAFKIGRELSHRPVVCSIYSETLDALKRHAPWLPLPAVMRAARDVSVDLKAMGWAE